MELLYWWSYSSGMLKGKFCDGIDQWVDALYYLLFERCFAFAGNRREEQMYQVAKISKYSHKHLESMGRGPTLPCIWCAASVLLRSVHGRCYLMQRGRRQPRVAEAKQR